MQPPDYKARLEMLLALTPAERKVHLLKEKVESERYWLIQMGVDFKADRAYSLKEIRQQRKGVQLWTKRLNAAKAMLEKNE